MSRRPGVSMETRLAHAGLGEPASATEPLVSPIYQTAVFTFDDLKLVDEVQDGETLGYMYSRYSNPNLAQLEEAVAAAEFADAGVAFASGMSAIMCSVLAVCGSGDHILATNDIYGGTRAMFVRDFQKFGIKTSFVDDSDLAQVSKAITSKTRVLYVETLTNPTLKVANIPALAALARQAGILLFVDNTFATPVLWRPLAQGADLIIHSATKYLGGHSDVTAGVAVGGYDLITKVRELNKSFGPTLDPFASWLTLRGLRTLTLRVKKSSDNAASLANHLSSHKMIKRVYYPGLISHPQHALAASQMNGGFGGMLSFELHKDLSVERFFRSIKLCTFAPSLGDCRTLLTHPAKTSHRSLTKEEQEAIGITHGLVRASCGIEDIQDIIADLEEALLAATGK